MENDWTSEKPYKPGYYDVRVMSGSTILNSKDRVRISERDLLKPRGYVHHSDNLRFRFVEDFE